MGFITNYRRMNRYEIDESVSLFCVGPTCCHYRSVLSLVLPLNPGLHC